MTTTTDQPDLYTSAAFKLDSPGIFFQFRLRRTAAEPLFALVRKSSPALTRLKAGAMVPMIFYHPDQTVLPEKIETRIKYITTAGAPGLNDHVMVALDINCAAKAP